MLARDYPHLGAGKVKRQYTVRESMKVFMRDGFIDRYSGQRLVFPAALRMLSGILGTDFPIHKNWKMGETHFAYWELFPTIDHIWPVARGGVDAEDNWATTSMLRNGAKAHWTLQELGWSLQPGGKLEDWDGLTSWALRQFNAGRFMDDDYIVRWCRAAKACQGETRMNTSV